MNQSKELEKKTFLNSKKEDISKYLNIPKKEITLKEWRKLFGILKK